MFPKASAMRSRAVLGGCTGSLALAIALALSSVVPVNAAHAATACAAAWQAGTVYTGGNVASKNGTNYVANWWTQGNDPATNSGGAGSGQPWTSQGACDGGTTTPPTDPGNPGGDPPTNPPPAAGDLLFSPYKDITINLDWNTNIMSTLVTGTRIPVVGSGSLVSTQVPNIGAITLAFATGECGSENWGGVPAAAFASANIARLNSAGVNYVVSTGGQAGTFTCGSTAGMAKFIQTYNSSHLVGIDFDIEGGQTPAQLNALIANAKYAAGLYPNLRFSFTLATLAASDGSYGGLNGTGDAVVRAVLASGLQNYTINLMTMDYGAAGAGVCVVSGGSCDMGQSAIQAAKNLQHTYGIPLTKIELTPMIGVNDVSSETFTLQDIDEVTAYAATNKLAGVHFWSLDRDTPCTNGNNGGFASPTCNSVSGTSALQYTRRFLSDLGR
ncbi:carbohydrate-binding protein [Dyella sp. 333MFSha]|uniref:carbohydrate-binding protein n=1 Tax=Dyella sp. 333MFSha TaxID=1798240 RepID=UPI00087E4BC9|nr:carbohydrate-binding protein [Dyella sp. 333MFSha]SDF45092.1 Carbohydrate binding domain-containing protein [Dyella sp. 333MFSha]